MRIEGRAICLGEDIDTDLIIAGRYLRTKERGVWASRAFEDLDPSLAKRLKGSIIIAGRNFGCGSSREQAAIALKDAGVLAVIAPSFGRIFFRNAINIGLPVLECECGCTEGAHIAIDLAEGRIRIDRDEYRSRPLSPRMQEILLAGGLVELWRGRH